MNAAELVALARSYDGVGPQDPRYTALMRHPGDDPAWAARYYPDPKTYTCALTVLGLWRLAGVRSSLLTDAYRPGYATADMGAIARGAGAYHDVSDLLRDRYRPQPGDAVMIVETSGRREHAFTIVDVLETEIGWRLETIDGGHSIKAVKRIWRRGPGRIVDDVDGRVVAYVVDVRQLLEASRAPDLAPDADPAPAPDTEPDYLLGVDVSQYQRPDEIDWSVVALTHRFCIARATYGLKPDPTFVRHIEGARAAGLQVGGYHFLWQDAPAEAQLEAFRAQLGEAGLGAGDILPAVDLEADGKRSPSIYVPRARAFLEALGAAMVYIGPAFYREVMGEAEWLRDYPWWVAHYTDRDAPDCPWVDWAIWQHRVAPLTGYAGRDPKTGRPLPIDQNRARRVPVRSGSGTGYL